MCYASGMEEESLQLAVSISNVVWMLASLVTVAGGFVALMRRAILLGVGLAVSGFLSILSFISRYLVGLFAESSVDGAINYLNVQAWVGVVWSLLHLICMLVVLVGAFRLVRP